MYNTAQYSAGSPLHSKGIVYPSKSAKLAETHKRRNPQKKRSLHKKLKPKLNRYLQDYNDCVELCDDEPTLTNHPKQKVQRQNK